MVSKVAVAGLGGGQRGGDDDMGPKSCESLVIIRDGMLYVNNLPMKAGEYSRKDSL